MVPAQEQRPFQPSAQAAVGETPQAALAIHVASESFGIATREPM
jgi:hypothetical protein